jgi:photosystem II stability/assembly factor-like uncharacterized protein
MLVARHFVLAAAVLLLLAGASYARGAPAAEAFSLSPSAIQVDPKRPNIVYASILGDDTRPGGVFKSTDAGKTWRSGAANLGWKPPPGHGLRVDALALDPRSPNVLYAGTALGVFKTTDGARTWKPASTGIDVCCHSLRHQMAEGFIKAIAIDPVDTSTVYAAGDRRVWKSTNGGVTWKWKRALRRWAGGLAIDPRRPETVYASMPPGYRLPARIHKTIDGGDSWRAIGRPGLHDNYFGHPIVIDRRSPGMIYAGGSKGLFASANQGRTWKKSLSRGVGAIALDPSRANVLYVGTWPHGVFKSDDGGQTWSAPRLAGRAVTSIAIAPTRPQTIYAGVQWKSAPQEWTGGMFASTNGGATWHRLF